MNIDIFDMNEALVHFNGYAMTRTETVWINRAISSNEWTHASVKSRFSFGVPGGCFADSMFDMNNVRCLSADRYGGPGIGTNGGSGRIGFIDGFQIKGIGRSPLVGQSKTEWHSYGGQSLIDAMLEAINSLVFGVVLPIGTIQCNAIIYTGSDTAYMPVGDRESVKGPGALLVRSSCARPANFLRAPEFRLRKDALPVVLDDVARTMRVNQVLYQKFGSHGEVVKYIGNFLSKCANQFSFSLLFRISHGVLSPSNTSLDGKWVDLTNVGFVNSGINFLNDDPLVSFFDEINEIISIVDEFMYTYGKYNNFDLNIAPLINYYREEVAAYTTYHAPRLFGLEAGVFSRCCSKDVCDDLMSAVRGLLYERPNKVIASSVNFGDADPIAIFLASLFGSITNRSSPVVGYAEPFYRLCLDIFSTSSSGLSFKSFLSRAAISSLKKAYFSSFFMRSRILKSLINVVEICDLSACADYIDSYEDIASWVFQSEAESRAVIFKSGGIEVAYDAPSSDYLITVRKKIFRLSCVSDLRARLNATRGSCFVVDGYDFFEAVTKILDVLESLEGVESNAH